MMEKRMTVYIQKKGNDRRFLFRTDLQKLPDTQDRIVEFRNLLRPEREEILLSHFPQMSLPPASKSPGSVRSIPHFIKLFSL